MPSVLVQFQQWYAAQCDGDWEHSYGIKIGNVDNPGWDFSINLQGTALEYVPFAEVKHNYDHDTEWFICCRTDTSFGGVGGPQQLEAMLTVFLQWAQAHTPA